MQTESALFHVIPENTGKWWDRRSGHGADCTTRSVSAVRAGRAGGELAFPGEGAERPPYSGRGTMQALGELTDRGNLTERVQGSEGRVLLGGGSEQRRQAVDAGTDGAFKFDDGG